MAKSKLREVRQQKGLSQMELSKLANLSHGYISEVENNIKSPTIETICKLAKALDCRPEELYECE